MARTGRQSPLLLFHVWCAESRFARSLTDSTKCKTPLHGRGCKFYRSRKGWAMLTLMLLVVLNVLLRTRRAKLKIKIDL
jgi:hypothetical protein